MGLSLRDPVPGDMGWMISMHGKTYAQDFQLAPQFELDIARKLVLFFDHASDCDRLFIAVVNGDRVGSIAVSKESATTAFVNFVLVIHGFREQGIATTMMHKVIDHARQQNFNTLRLETYSCLQGARHLYKKLGFQMVRRNLAIKKYGQVFDQEFWELGL